MYYDFDRFKLDCNQLMSIDSFRREQNENCKKHWKVDKNAIFQVDSNGKAIVSSFAFGQ